MTADVPIGYDVDHVRLTLHDDAPETIVHVGDDEVNVPEGNTQSDPFHVLPVIQDAEPVLVSSVVAPLTNLNTLEATDPC